MAFGILLHGAEYILNFDDVCLLHESHASSAVNHPISNQNNEWNHNMMANILHVWEWKK